MGSLGLSAAAALTSLFLFASILGCAANPKSEGVAYLAPVPGDAVFLATLEGELVWPFAVYDAGEWTRLSWFEPPPELEVAGSVWYGRSFSGETLLLKGLEVVPIEGSAAWYGGEWAIRTDYDNTQARERLAGTGVTAGGLIVTEPIPITLAVDGSPEGETAGHLYAAARGHFSELEAALIIPESFPTYAVTAAERDQFPIETMRVQKVSLSPNQDLFLYRTRREYGRWEPTDSGEEWVCSDLTDMESWILRQGADVRFISGAVNRSNCAEYGAYETTVIGSVALDSITYVVVKILGYEGAQSSIYRFSDDSVRHVMSQF